MSGKIRKSKKEKDYTVIPNAYLRIKELSWKAKGLLTYLLSMSDGWEVFKSDLANRSKDGYESMLGGWKELEAMGYIETKEIRSVGLFKGFEYVIHESPIRGFTESGKPISGNPELISNSLEEVLPLIDTKVSNVGLPASNTTEEKNKSVSDRCLLFVEKFNSIKVVNGKKSKYRSNNSLCGALKQRLKTYTSADIIKALKNAMKDEYHKSSNYFYLTPEYILRPAIIERFLNVVTSEEINDESKPYNP